MHQSRIRKYAPVLLLPFVIALLVMVVPGWRRAIWHSFVGTPLQFDPTYVEVAVTGALLVIGLVVLRLFAGELDRDRVKAYIEARGGELLEVRWAPFGPGWPAEGASRIYRVRYFDKDRNERLAYCKTSMWSGVYFTWDNVVKHGDSPR